MESGEPAGRDDPKSDQSGVDRKTVKSITKEKRRENRLISSVRRGQFSTAAGREGRTMPDFPLCRGGFDQKIGRITRWADAHSCCIKNISSQRNYLIEGLNGFILPGAFQ